MRLVSTLLAVGLALVLAVPASAMARRAPEDAVAQRAQLPLTLSRDEPVTLTLTAPEEGTPVLELEFDALESGDYAAPFVRVFLGTETGGARQEPGYVGSASFFPLPLAEPMTMALDIAPAAKKLGAGAATEGGVPVTLVLGGSRPAREGEPALTARLSAVRLRAR